MKKEFKFVRYTDLIKDFESGKLQRPDDYFISDPYPPKFYEFIRSVMKGFPVGCMTLGQTEKGLSIIDGHKRIANGAFVIIPNPNDTMSMFRMRGYAVYDAREDNFKFIDLYKQHTEWQFPFNRITEVGYFWAWDKHAEHLHDYTVISERVSNFVARILNLEIPVQSVSCSDDEAKEIREFLNCQR